MKDVSIPEEEELIEEIMELSGEDLVLLSKIERTYREEEILKMELKEISDDYVLEEGPSYLDPHEYFLLETETVPPEIESKLHELSEIEKKRIEYLKESKKSEDLSELDLMQTMYEKYSLKDD
ncbi:MAG: hypothetical protein ACLFS3_00020 [Candidatus Aenigmatarchaeota archaeon]